MEVTGKYLVYEFSNETDRQHLMCIIPWQSPNVLKVVGILQRNQKLRVSEGTTRGKRIGCNVD